MIIKTNHLGIVVEKEYEDKAGRFDMDPMYDPTKNARTYGKVKHLPMSFTHGWNLDNDFFQVGDTVHFHYDAINDAATISFEDEDGDKVYIVDVFKVYLRERDGEITPRPGKCVCEPYYETGDPKRFRVEDVKIEGKPAKAIVSILSGIPIKYNPEPHDRLAKVRLVGKPLEHEPVPDFHPGDVVFRDLYCNLAYQVQGETVFIIDNELIWGVMTEL